MQVTPCGPTTPCAHGHFCDEHFGLCLPTRPAGQYCRRDTHCAHGLLCTFGKCQQPVPDGQEGEQQIGVGGNPITTTPGAEGCDGARCQRDEDCGAGGCCARRHGELLCQQRLELGQSCHVPPGGLAFSINQVCPCQAGLVLWAWAALSSPAGKGPMSPRPGGAQSRD
uniref:Dickkopf N-terminal cysteine-rich domain-containing protein n=1 Tax=Pavo cristatus TaxID=9049 RepID=A0A8C9L658_PAVCR